MRHEAADDVMADRVHVVGGGNLDELGDVFEIAD